MEDNIKSIVESIGLDPVQGNPAALNAISEKLQAFSKEELLGIFKNSPHTLNNIAGASCQG